MTHQYNKALTPEAFLQKSEALFKNLDTSVTPYSNWAARHRFENILSGSLCALALAPLFGSWAATAMSIPTDVGSIVAAGGALTTFATLYSIVSEKGTRRRTRYVNDKHNVPYQSSQEPWSAANVSLSIDLFYTPQFHQAIERWLKESDGFGKREMNILQETLADYRELGEELQSYCWDERNPREDRDAAYQLYQKHFGHRAGPIDLEKMWTDLQQKLPALRERDELQDETTLMAPSTPKSPRISRL
jgi:hypothetical protein